MLREPHLALLGTESGGAGLSGRVTHHLARAEEPMPCAALNHHQNGHRMRMHSAAVAHGATKMMGAHTHTHGSGTREKKMAHISGRRAHNTVAGVDGFGHGQGDDPALPLRFSRSPVQTTHSSRLRLKPSMWPPELCQ